MQVCRQRVVHGPCFFVHALSISSSSSQDVYTPENQHGYAKRCLERWLLFKYWPMFGTYSFNFREGITKDFRPWINLDQRPSLQVHIAGLAREAASMVAQRVDPVVSYFFLKNLGSELSILFISWFPEDCCTELPKNSWHAK